MTDQSTNERSERASLDATTERIAELDGAQNALNKMRRAARRGTGCRLTSDEISSLELTVVGEMWAQDDPRSAASHKKEDKA